MKCSKNGLNCFLYNTEVCVQLTVFFIRILHGQKGLRWRDPISAYMLILCTEILNIKIRNSKNIFEIKIKDEEHIISQFADDITLLLDGSENSLTMF